MSRLEFSQGLRGSAAMLVVFFHAHNLVDDASFKRWSEPWCGSERVRAWLLARLP